MNAEMIVSQETWTLHDGDTGWAVCVAASDGTYFDRESGHDSDVSAVLEAQAKSRRRLLDRARRAARR